MTSRYDYRGAASAALLAVLCACAPLQHSPKEPMGLTYPPPPRGTTVEDYHGVKVADPYRALEDLDAPATRAWVAAEARLTQAYLDAIPQRAPLRERLAQLYDFERTGIPFAENGHYFYTNNSGRQEQSVLLSVAPLTGLPAVALDPNLLPPGAHPVVTGYVANHAATLLAYAVSPA